MENNENQEVQWFYGGEGEATQPSPKKKLPYVSTWANFEKLSDDEKKKTFNSMRGELIANGLLEDKEK